MLIWESRRQKMAAADSGWKEFVNSFSDVDLYLRNFNSLTVDYPEIYAPISTVAVSLTDVPLWYPQVYWHDYTWIKTFPHYVGIPSQSWCSLYLQKSAFDHSAFMGSWVLCNSICTKTFASGKYHKNVIKTSVLTNFNILAKIFKHRPDCIHIRMGKTTFFCRKRKLNGYFKNYYDI